ncbi:NAD(+) diphosphatase [Mesobaculum littorinae]|uniref:NAD(+) diphosphatase n=1 Tax=Mesobaculum littorinae TaxID=2486419 RepID=A0A438AFS4_9RHOB|nr:NAD(+) diphosphatase [Mesobaculum littorinae]RVV97457.1 NAD(+) diphosphatase [Mesobaculum littorinae]
MKLAETVTFGGSGLDRAAHLRGDADALDGLAGQEGAGVLPVWAGKPLFDMGREGAPQPGWLDPGDPRLAGRARIFLGLDGGPGGAGRFACDVSDWALDPLPEGAGGGFSAAPQGAADLPDHLRFAELRGLMSDLDPRAAELAVTARALLAWHGAHRFCANCGASSDVAMAGWQRNCPACGRHHFPRTDPVVIMLITHGNDVLVGRSPAWPEGMFSLLAGFVEPGEGIEAAVRREVAEETGVPVGEVGYLASQPWPFPASLMLGCRGTALSRDIHVDGVEVETALWVSREEMAEAFLGRHPLIRTPRRGAIAGFLLANWLADRLD